MIELNPLLDALNKLRAVFSHLCIRGISNIAPNDLQQLQDAADFFNDAGASHFSEHLQQFLSLRESQPKQAAQCLLALQCRTRLLEREFSRAEAIETLTEWIDQDHEYD